MMICKRHNYRKCKPSFVPVLSSLFRRVRSVFPTVLGSCSVTDGFNLTPVIFLVFPSYLPCNTSGLNFLTYTTPPRYKGTKKVQRTQEYNYKRVDHIVSSPSTFDTELLKLVCGSIWKTKTLDTYESCRIVNITTVTLKDSNS